MLLAMMIVASLLTWETMHPAVVHFPIALLLTAPLFIVLSVIWPSRNREMLTSATLLVLLGTAGAGLAVATGEAAEGAAKGIAAAEETFEFHEHTAERARNLFFGVTGVMVIATLITWSLGTRLKPIGKVALALLLLGVYAYPAITLAQAAQAGGRLVHEFGVRAVPLPGR
jgi:uncharacterized membrane protein